MNDSVNTEANSSPKVKGKPGRKPREQSAAGLTIFEAQREGVTKEESRDPNKRVEAERVRVPFGAGQDQWLNGYQLDWDNFHYHEFHESATRGGRIAEADRAFYEHCTINGENIKRPSGNGWSYLMRLPQKYYQEDLAKARQNRKMIEKDMNTLKSKDGIQDYAVDQKTGRVVLDGAPDAAKHSVSENPYA